MEVLRRKMVGLLPGSTTQNLRYEVYKGHSLKYMLISVNTDEDAEFAVEVNGIEIINCAIRNLTRENGIRKGFDATTGGVNSQYSILPIEMYADKGMSRSSESMQVTFVSIADAGGANIFKVTVVYSVNI